MNPIFTKSDLTKPVIKKTKSEKNIKNQIESVSDSEPYNNQPQQQDQCEMILDINDIMKTIPENALISSNNELGKTHTEWRWRFFNLKGRKLIEISKKNPNEDRMYVDNTGTWVHYNGTNQWDKFLVKTMYHYVMS